MNQSSDTPAKRTTGTAPGAEGVSIAYEIIGEGETALVFIHGWSCDKTFWRNQVEEFSSDHQVITMDLAGHGHSGDDRENFSVASFGQDIASVLDHLDVDQIILVGHSMGGPVVVEAAILLGDRIKSVIGIDTLKNVDQPRFTQEQRESMRAASEHNFKGTTEAFVRSTMFSEHSPQHLVDEIAIHMSGANERVAKSASDDYLTMNFGERLAHITQTPLGLINGDAHPMNEDALKVSHPDAKILYIEKTGHFPMLEAPKAFNSALRKMLETL